MVPSRTPNRPVATCVIMWSSYGRMRSMYPPSPVQLNVLNATAARALDNWVTLLTDPNDMPPPYQGTSILILGRSSSRLFSRMLVSIWSSLSLTRSEEHTSELQSPMYL